MCEPKSSNGAGTAVAVGGVFAATLVAPAVLAFAAGVMAGALLAVFSAAALAVAFTVWYVRREMRCEMWRPAKELVRPRSVQRGGYIELPPGELARSVGVAEYEGQRAIGPPRRVVATVVSRTDEPADSLTQ